MVTVGVAVCAIPPRVSDMLPRALVSILAQTRPADAISVSIDIGHKGAAVNRNRSWRGLDTDYIAFLDDDDEFGPDHLGLCLAEAETTSADLVFPWFQVVGGTDPYPETFGVPWDPAAPRQTTVTCLWRRSALESIGGFPELSEDGLTDGGGNRRGEDYEAILRLNAAGGRIVHLAERTWNWHHHSTNTSGLATRW